MLAIHFESYLDPTSSVLTLEVINSMWILEEERIHWIENKISSHCSRLSQFVGHSFSEFSKVAEFRKQRPEANRSTRKH